MEIGYSKICCVTGGAGYIGSWLVKKLLEKGHVVHATLRNLGDPMKVGLLKAHPGADTRLRLFQADLYGDAGEFAAAIDGCEFVFHVATPWFHDSNSSKYTNTIEATVASAKNILESCIASGSVKRLIYTGSVSAASPLMPDGNYKDFIDESCWTSLDIPFANSNDFFKDYTCSKTLAEKELLKHNEKEDKGGMEVVSLAVGAVGGGDTALPPMPIAVGFLVSPWTGDMAAYGHGKLAQELLGSVPVVHVDDVCEAHIFCMERAVVPGRFLLAADYPTVPEILDVCRKKDIGQLMIEKEEGMEKKKKVMCGSTKLADVGFNCKYDLDQIVSGSIQCAKRFGVL